MDRQYICIDFKSFFASVECVERGLDPMSAKLIVADPERKDTTVCLAVSPALKKLGVKNRCRVYEIPKNIEYIMASPRMRLYIEYSANAYAVYLKYVAKEDIYIYSIDEAFIDVTDYLPLYKMTARELGEKIRQDVLKTIGVPSAFGIGTNLYLAKIALDIEAKKSDEFIGELNQQKYISELWDHKPITDFWRIGAGIAARLEKYGITTMRALANANPEFLKGLFGVDYEIMLDHAWGIEPVTIKDIKSYKNKTHSLSSGQVLSRDYNFNEGLTIVKEMSDALALELFDSALVSRSVTVYVTYSGAEREGMRGSVRLEGYTNSSDKIISACALAYSKAMNKERFIRKINISINDVIPEGFEQQNLFETSDEREKEKNKMQAVSDIKKRFGKNAILRGLDLKSEATARERNRQIGGHKSGEGEKK